MSSPPRLSTLTRLLDAAHGGDPEAFDAGFALVYDELKAIAKRQRRRWRGAPTLNTTALVNEAYLKLAGPDPPGVEGRAHFFALASTAMRHILCNHARERSAQKRGGGAAHVTFDESGPSGAAAATDPADTLLALDGALRRLEAVAPRQGRVVECRFFGGLSVEETARALDLSPRTVKRDWALAQAWLQRDMRADA